MTLHIKTLQGYNIALLLKVTSYSSIEVNIVSITKIVIVAKIVARCRYKRKHQLNGRDNFYVRVNSIPTS